MRVGAAVARRKKTEPTPKTSTERIDAKAAALQKKTEPAPDLRFWEHGDDAYRAVWSDADRMKRVTRFQRERDLYFMSLYDDDGLASLVVGRNGFANYTPELLSSNICKRQVDTFVSKLSKNRPVPMGLTTGGNYSQQRRAKSLSGFFAGILDKVDFWDAREQRLRDGAVCGDGFAFNYRVGREFFHDRIFPWQVSVHPFEGQLGKPRTFRLDRYIDKLVLKEQFPEAAEQIDEAEGKDEHDGWDPLWDDTCDLVLVRGIWHLPSSANASDGAFALCISNKTLELKEYKRPYPPFSRFTFAPPQIGWRGTGMVKQLAPIQFEVNAIGMRLQEQAYMTGSYVFIEDGAGIETDTIDNGTLTVVRYRGSPPQFHNPSPFHPQLFDYYMNLRGRFPAEESRISEMTTRGEIPGGLSGRARRLHHDIEAEGFITQGRADERDVINTCWQFFDLLEEVHEERGEEKDERKPYVLKVEQRQHGRTMLQDVNYDDVRLDREALILRVFPTSFLNGTPQENAETVRELTKDGFLSQDEALALLDFPDLQGVLNLRTAARRNIERLLEKLKDADDPDAVYETPVAAWNFDLCRALALMTYLESKLDGVPEKNLKAILQFAADASAEMKRAQEAANAPPADAAGDAPIEQLPPEEAAALMPQPGEQFVPPAEPILPANAVAPEAMPLVPEM
jgi:hypothetical protein